MAVEGSHFANKDAVQTKANL